MMVELICPSCHFSKEVPRAKIPVGAKWATCPSCHQRFEFSVPEQAPDFIVKGEGFDEGFQETVKESEKESPRQGAPWEKRSEVGLWQGIYKTLTAVLFSPQNLFGTMTFESGISEPLAFGLLAGSLGSMFGFFWHFLVLAGGVFSYGYSIFSQFATGLIFLVMMIMVPLFVIVAMFIYSGILHLLLVIVRGGKNRYEATFRVVSYSQAAQVWCLIPFIGGWIGGIWQLIVQIIGLRVIHETSYLRVVVAFLIPLGLIILLVIAVLISLVIFINQSWFSWL